MSYMVAKPEDRFSRDDAQTFWPVECPVKKMSIGVAIKSRSLSSTVN